MLRICFSRLLPSISYVNRMSATLKNYKDYAKRWKYVPPSIFSCAVLTSEHDGDDSLYNLKTDLADLTDHFKRVFCEYSALYREYLMKQIVIAGHSSLLGPLDEHWDKMVQYRVEAADLQEELFQYKLIMAKQRIIYNENKSYEIIQRLFINCLSDIEAVFEEENQKNKEIEKKLLQFNVASIYDSKY